MTPDYAVTSAVNSGRATGRDGNFKYNRAVLKMDWLVGGGIGSATLSVSLTGLRKPQFISINGQAANSVVLQDFKKQPRKAE